MYSKYKIQNGLNIDGLMDLLRKTKMGLLKVITNPEYLKGLISSALSKDTHNSE